MMRTIGFCHLLLQSRAPVSRSLPTRSSRIGHPAVSRRQRGWSGESLEFQLFSTSCRACHVSSAAPACGSLRSGPRIVKASRSLATTLVKASPCRGPARLRSKGALLQRASCDARRARTRRGSFVRTCSTPTVLPPSGRALRLFAAAIPRWFFQTRLLRLGPRSRPRSNRCGRFLGPDAAFRLLQRIFNGRHTSTNPRASSSPAAGGCPVVVATHDALFTLAAPSSFSAKKVRPRCAAASYAIFPDTRPREPSPAERSSSAPLRTTPFRWARRTWETRRPKELSKGKRPRSCERSRPFEACASRSLLVGSFERLLSPAMRARWDGSPFACLYTSASLA